MTPVGQFHLATSLVALATGAWVLRRRKGTANHRRIGWLYAASMLALNISALSIYRLTGRFGPFHVAALISLATLLAGVWAVWRRRPNDKSWLPRHYHFMTWSYLGLVAAAVAEVATRVPAKAAAGGPSTAFWATVALASIAVFVIGGRMILRREKSILRPFQRA